MTDIPHRKTHFLRLVEPDEAEPLARSSFVRPAWQSTLFANSNPSLIVFVNCENITDEDFITTIEGSHPKFIFDVRRVPRFDIGQLTRRGAFDAFRAIGAQYIDLTSVHRRRTSQPISFGLIAEAIQDARPFSPKGGPIIILVDSNQFSEAYITSLLETLPSEKDEPWDVLRIPVDKPVQESITKRDVVFISHANPKDNEFATWLAQQLTLCGFSVWCDVRNLAAGDRFWEEIESCIRTRSAKIIVVLSKNSQSAAGVLDEVDLAIRVERALGLQRFVLPIRLDNLPFSEVRANLGRKNIIDFSENWARGLRAIVDVLERDRVPHTTNLHPNITNFGNSTDEKTIRLVARPEILTSNWLLIKELPKFVHFYDVAAPTEQIENIAAALKTPHFRHLRLLGLFCDANSVEEPSATGALTRQYKIPIEDFLSGNATEAPSIKSREARNVCSSMLRQVWNKEMESRGLRSFSMASNALAWYMPLDFIDRNTITFSDEKGKKRRKMMVNWSDRRKVYWHFAVEARPVLGLRPRYVLRQHVIFTADGFTPLVSKERMHALRRRFCKSWWNDRWRDLLVGFVAWLNSSPGGFSLSSDTRLIIDETLLSMISPLSMDGGDAESGDAGISEMDEELSSDDDFDEFEDPLELESSENQEAIDP